MTGVVDGVMPLAAIVTTDLAAITRGRSVPAHRLEAVNETGIGWLPANLSLTPFNSIASPNPWGSRGDLRVLPDMNARFRTGATGAATPFDMVMGDIVELDGRPWHCCPRGMLKDAAAELHEATGLSLLASFEQEFQLSGSSLPAAHSLSVAALRRVDPFPSRLACALSEAGIEPETLIAEFGAEQFEVTCSPTDPVAAADRAVAIREITRETARNHGWQASFAPKTMPAAVGNGVHIHFSLVDRDGGFPGYDKDATGGVSSRMSAFCAGILRHMPALTLLTAPSPPSYYRLQPNSWSASYAWLAERDREAGLRICPVVTIGGRDPARQFNIEYRAADATANPYVALSAIIRAGLIGIKEDLRAELVAEHPTAIDVARLEALGIRPLPRTVDDAIAAFRDDRIVTGWFPSVFVETFLGVRAAEIQHLQDMSPEQVCALYGVLY